MQVQDGMTETVLTVGPGHTLRHVARQMSERRVGAAVVHDPQADGPGIITERDILDAVGRGQDPDSELVGDHLVPDIVVAAPTWSLEQAATEMVRRRFRHLIVVSGADIVGVLSMRDIVRVWTTDGATCDLPGEAERAA